MKILYFIITTFFLSIFLVPSTSTAQNSDSSASSELGGTIAVDAAKKEEIHRYMGYERLLPKYLSLPYDVNMNTNIKGEFIDVGYLYLMFLPLILLTAIKNNRIRIGIGCLLFIFLVFSIPTGYAAFNNVSIFELQAHLDNQLTTVSFSSAPLMFLKLKLTQIFSLIYLPLDRLITPISGEGDYITLPLIFILFVFLFSLIEKGVNFSDKLKQILLYLVLCYCFLWLILGAGIIWYGILFIALGLILMSIYIFKPKYISSWLTNSFLAFSFIWCILATVNRFSDYSAPKNAKLSMGAIKDVTLAYGAGAYNENQVKNLIFPNYNQALNEINQDPSVLVYRVGTFLHYFIDNNNERVLVDNQLGLFNQLSSAFEDKEQLTAAFKANNYKYILIDPNTATIDLTPNKTLTKKYEKLIDFVQNNPGIQFLATDRTFKNGKIEKPGTFAVFKII